MHVILWWRNTGNWPIRAHFKHDHVNPHDLIGCFRPGSKFIVGFRRIYSRFPAKHISRAIQHGRREGSSSASANITLNSSFTDPSSMLLIVTMDTVIVIKLVTLVAKWTTTIRNRTPLMLASSDEEPLGETKLFSAVFLRNIASISVSNSAKEPHSEQGDFLLQIKWKKEVENPNLLAFTASRAPKDFQLRKWIVNPATGPLDISSCLSWKFYSCILQWREIDIQLDVNYHSAGEIKRFWALFVLVGLVDNPRPACNIWCPALSHTNNYTTPREGTDFQDLVFVYTLCLLTQNLPHNFPRTEHWTAIMASI